MGTRITKPISIWGDALHLFTLGAFALAQPLFEMFARGPHFFFVRRAQPIDVLLLVGILILAAPCYFLALEGLARCFGVWPRRVVHYLAVASLMAMIALPAWKYCALQGDLLFVLAVVTGITFAVAYARWEAPRLLLTVLTPAVLIFPGWFLSRPSIAKALTLGRPAPRYQEAVGNPAPVVMVIFDEFNGMALLDENREVDAARFPHFAALAKDSTWFRNATTSHYATSDAVPAMLSGTYSGKHRVPRVDDFRGNLFTLLNAHYELRVSETFTDLCPPRPGAEKRPPPLWNRLEGLLLDAGVAYLHLVLPKDKTAFLPSIRDKWGNFLTPKRNLRDKMRIYDRDVFFEEFLTRIQPSDRPTVDFLHCVLPHVPYDYLPSGKQYRALSSLPSVVGVRDKVWQDDDWASAHHQQRFLLQVGFVDTLVGRLVAHLKKIGLYDKCILVITADHGVSFHSGWGRRLPHEANLQDILPVPLFIKTPGQRAGIISDRNVETIDVLPTLASVLQVSLPWKVDGVSALDSQIPERPRKRVFDADWQPLELDGRFEEKYASSRQLLARFGNGKRPDGLYRIGPHSRLVGKPLTEVHIGERTPLEVSLENQQLFVNVDPSARLQPCLASGVVRPEPSKDSPVELAVVVNGVIRATCRTYHYPGHVGRWAAMIPENCFVSGSNDVRVYVLESKQEQVVLHPTREYARRVYEMVTTDKQEVIRAADGKEYIVVEDGVQGWVDLLQERDVFVQFHGWAGDVRAHQPAAAVAVFLDQHFLYADDVMVPRRDVAKIFGNRQFDQVGFSFTMPKGWFNRGGVRIIALGHNGKASELKYCQEFEDWRAKLPQARDNPKRPGLARGASSTTPVVDWAVRDILVP